MDSSTNTNEKLIKESAQPQIQQMQAQMQPQIQPQLQPQLQQPTTSFTIFFFKFFSVISWILLIFTSLEAYLRKTFFFSIHKLYINKEMSYFPISINIGMLQSFFLILLFFGFYNFAYCGLYKKNNAIVDPLFTNITKYHFIPLLLVSFINMNLHSLKDFYYSNPSKENFETIKGEIYDDLTFTLIALLLMGFIYIKTNLEHNWFSVLTIKKGLFSSLIVILWYNVFYTSELIGYINNESNFGLFDFLKGSGIAFSLLIGIGALLFSFIFCDLIVAVTNLLIYIGMVHSFFGIHGKDSTLRLLTGGVADGVIEIVIMVLNLGLIFLLIFKYNNNLTENKFAS